MSRAVGQWYSRNSSRNEHGEHLAHNRQLDNIIPNVEFDQRTGRVPSCIGR